MRKTAMFVVILIIIAGVSFIASTKSSNEGCSFYSLKAANGNCIPMYVSYCSNVSASDLTTAGIPIISNQGNATYSYKFFFDPSNSTLTKITSPCAGGCKYGSCINGTLPPIVSYTIDYLTGFYSYIR